MRTGELHGDDLAKRGRRNHGRKWCLPPTITVEPDETLEGLAVLAEFPGDPGLALWQTLREVTLWAGLEREARPRFLQSGVERRLELLNSAQLDPVVEIPLMALATLLRDEEGARPESLAALCDQVSQWATERAASRTALHFAQAAALAHPESAPAALRVGVLASAQGQRDRSETWFRRAIGVARRARDWRTYAAAYIELGTLYRGRPDGMKRVEQCLVVAYRVGRRTAQRDIVARAQHGLFLLKMAMGDPDTALRHAVRALRNYTATHPALPTLRVEMVPVLLRQERFEEAIQAIRRTLPTRRGRERAHLLALLARGAAGLEDRALFEQSWNEAWVLVEAARDEAAGAVLVELVRAAASMGEPERVKQVARLRSSID